MDFPMVFMDMPGGSLSGIPELSLNSHPKGKGRGNPFQPHIPWIFYFHRIPGLLLSQSPARSREQPPLSQEFFAILWNFGKESKTHKTQNPHPWWNSHYPTWIIPEILSFSISFRHLGRFQMGSWQWWNYGMNLWNLSIKSLFSSFHGSLTWPRDLFGMSGALNLLRTFVPAGSGCFHLNSSLFS